MDLPKHWFLPTPHLSILHSPALYHHELEAEDGDLGFWGFVWALIFSNYQHQAEVIILTLQSLLIRLKLLHKQMNFSLFLKHILIKV